MLQLDDWQKEILNTKGNILLVAGRQTGKSTIISIRDGKRAAESPNESILIIAPTERQAEEIFNKTLYFISDNYKGMIKSGKDRPTKHTIKLKNGSIIRCLPVGQSGIGIRGLTLTKLTCEEASYLPEETWHAVTPMLLTTGGDMDLLGTPHGQQGYFYECYLNKDKRFKVFHVNTEEVMKNRPLSVGWTEHNRTKALEYLESEKRSMSENRYLQEYGGVFVKELKQYFSDALISSCMKLKRVNAFDPNNRKLYLGVDIARMGGDQISYSILDATTKDCIKQIEQIEYKYKLTTETELEILRLNELYDFRQIYIDAGAGTLGVSILDHLLENSKTKRKIVAINNRDRPLDIDQNSKSKMLKEDLYDNLLYLMQSGKILLLDDENIFNSLKSVQYEYIITPNSSTKLRIYGNYTHIAESLVRCAYCVKDKRLNIWCA